MEAGFAAVGVLGLLVTRYLWIPFGGGDRPMCLVEAFCEFMYVCVIRGFGGKIWW